MFNCQGGGWCPATRRNKSFSEFSHTVTSSVSPKDIEWTHAKRPVSIKGVNVFAIYMSKQDRVKLLKYSDKLEVSLDPFSFELLTVAPVTVVPQKLVQFAPIGLVNMLNCGGAVQTVETEEQGRRVGVRGYGEMRAFASERPVGCRVDGVEVGFEYEETMVRVNVPWNGSSSRLSVVEFLF